MVRHAPFAALARSPTKSALSGSKFGRAFTLVNAKEIDDNIGGIAVHIGARVAALAAPSQILVSSTVRDLVAGSGLRFVDRGEHSLKGVPGEWRIYAVDR
jgi:class 3 adenylate cyclase